MNAEDRRETDGAPAPWTWKTAGLALAWSACVFTAYLANGREIISGDTIPAKYLTFALVRGDGFYLDRYRTEAFKVWHHPEMPYYLQMVDGHYVSHYPVGPVFVALPFSVPQILFLDWSHPGWETSDPLWFDTITKRSSAAIAALAALALLAVLRTLVPEREAWLAATAAALGSNLWCTASQTLWQHGPAALMLTLVVLLLLPESPSRLRFFLAGLAAALLVCSRPIALAFAVTTAVWVAIRHPRRLVWFLPPAVMVGCALVSYNRAYLGLALGRYSPFDAPLFTTPLQEGLLGTLLSPNRGLFVFSPWTVLAFAYLPFAFFRLRLQTLLPWLLATLLAHAVLISKFTVWWAGWSFGPRYWTEVIPLLAIVLGLALQWAPRLRCRPVYAITVASIALAIGIQILGAFEYPSGWDEFPQSVDIAPQRIWDWSDTELSRCLLLSKAYQALFGPPEIPASWSAPPSPPVATEPPVIARLAGGTLDRVGCERIEGWAWYRQEPNTAIEVRIYDGETLIETVMADRPRQDLVRGRKGNGRHGFVLTTPASLRDGKTHEIHARIAEGKIELNKSPQELECPPSQSQETTTPIGP